jgi:putative spermidine/putrescine transport system substrate-binding protein
MEDIMSRKISRRQFLQMSAVAGASAVVAACAPKATPAPVAEDLLASGNSIPLDKLVPLAQKEGNLTTIALPHNWANYGEIIETFKTKYSMQVNELNPDAGSATRARRLRM